MRKVTLAGLVLPVERLDQPVLDTTLRQSWRPRSAGSSTSSPQPPPAGQPPARRPGVNDARAAMIGDLERRPRLRATERVVSPGWRR
jgi:hypothetical protein